MENRNKYLWILTLLSLAFGSATFNSYGQNNNEKVQGTEPIKIYGSANIEGAENFGLKYPLDTDFAPSLISPKKKERSEGATFDASLKLGFEKKFSLQEKDCKSIIEFAADRENVHLRRLYAEFGCWSLGLKESNFCNIAIFSANKAIQASWETKFSTNFSFALGIEQAKRITLYPKEKYTEDKIKGFDLQPFNQYPAATSRIQYDLSNDFGNIELSGLVRFMEFYNNKQDKTLTEFGWGVNLGTKLNLSPAVTILTANIIYGQGIGNYIHDLNKMEKREESSVYVKPSYVDIKSITSGGTYLSVEHRWIPALRSTFSGGITMIMGEDKKDRPSTSYKMGAYGSANLMYWLTEQTAFGAEYAWGIRENLDKAREDAHQLKAIATFKF